jgi:quercetin dioxygenase-like cupin family protein
MSDSQSWSALFRALVLGALVALKRFVIGALGTCRIIKWFVGGFMRRFLSVLLLSATCIAQTNSTSAILTNSEGERYDLKFGTAIMKVTSVQTGGTWSMVDFTASPGVQTMLHRHPKTDETFFVLEGDLTMYVDGKLSTLHHGDMAYVPKMTPHAFANLSDQPVRFLGTFTPSGFEKFFALAAEAGKAHAPGTPEYAAAMQKVHQQVDYEPLGPPPFGKPELSAH